MKRFRIVSKKKALRDLQRANDEACFKSSRGENVDHAKMNNIFYKICDIERLPKWQTFVIVKKGDDD